MIGAEPVGPQPGEPLGSVFAARSGDKGGNANVGVYAADDAGYAWLAANVTVDALRRLIPEAADLEVRRFELPNLHALNFVIVGYLGEGRGCEHRLRPAGQRPRRVPPQPHAAVGRPIRAATACIRSLER